MPEALAFLAFLAFLAALFLIELWYIAHHQKTISEHIQALFHSWPAIGFVVGVIVGWLGAHWFG
jgi:uncharacterized membrane protein YdjX (TVP38/TMEM64 family)